MRDYLKTIERHTHLFMLMVAEDAKDMLKSDGFTEEEKKDLRKACEWIDKFSISLFKRFGKPFERKQLNTIRDNKISIVGKFAPTQQAISHCAQEDLMPCFDDYRMLKCFNCKKCQDREQFTNCSVYAMGIAVDYLDDENAKVKESGCPFSMGSEYMPDFDLGFDEEE